MPGLGTPEWQQMRYLPEWEQRYGTAQFGMGGMYGAPQGLETMFQGMAGPQQPRVAAPGMGQMRQYALGAQDIAGRGAAIQQGHALQATGGMNPAMRAAAMAQASQAGAGVTSQAGLGGMQMGGQMLQRANMANAQMQMQERGAQRQMFGQGLDRTMAMRQAMLDRYRDRFRYYMSLKYPQGQGGGGGFGDFLGAVAPIAGAALGSIIPGVGTAVGGAIGGAAGKAVGNRELFA